VKRFTIPCGFGGIMAPFDVYVGEAAKEPDDAHPLEQQAAWLLRERGGVVPAGVMASFARLFEIAKKEGVRYEDLCVYALETAQAGGSTSPDGEESAEARPPATA
jgi:hypothetical protein